jgi:hypothetical protein
VGSSRHSGGGRGDWQDQPQPWEYDPYSSQQSHQHNGPPGDDNSQWPQTASPDGPAGGDARWARPPPSWGNDAVSDDPRWAEPPAWANEAPAGDDGHWAHATGNGADYWDDDPYQAGPPGADPYQAAPPEDKPYQAGPQNNPYQARRPGVHPYQTGRPGADPYQAGPQDNPYRTGRPDADPHQARQPGADPYQARPPGADPYQARPPGADPYQARPPGEAAAQAGGGPYWSQPYGADVSPDDDPYWARPSGTGAPPPDDDPYWGQPPRPRDDQFPPGQEVNWAAGPQAWGAEGTIPVPPSRGSATGGPAGPDDRAMHVSELPGSWTRPTEPGGVPGGIPARRRRRFWVPLVVALVGVVLVAAIVIVTRRDSGNAAAGPTPSGSTSAGSTPSASRPGATGTTGAKQAPITAANIFPQTHLSIAGLRFTQVAATTTTECSTAAQGEFASALSSAHCRRVVRATYVDARKQYVITAGVASLPTHVDAVSADRTKQFGSDDWFTALNGPASSGAGSASRNAGVGDDVVDDRFIVFALSSYADGHNPSGNTTEIKTLTGLSQAFSGAVERQLVSRGGWS